jgi:hypothetical protein
MANHASFDQRLVLIHVRPLLFCVALIANRIARSIGPQLVRSEGAVRIVAVVARHEPFVHSVVKRPGKLCAHITVTAVAKSRRLSLEQELTFFGVMRIVAIDARNSIHQMRRPLEVAVLFRVLMAAQAPRAGFLG